MNKVKSVQVFSILLFSCIVLSVSLLGQGDDEGSVALRIDVPIELDGQLSEPAWAQAMEAAAYLQSHPLRDEPSQVRTVVKILYDNGHLYLGFECIDSQPDKIIADISDRDGELRNDDSVHVLLDSIHDAESFYYFATNLRGAKSDGKVSLVGKAYDPSWQGDWEAAASKTEYGWSAEIIIAFSSLGYEASSQKSLGLGISRVVPRLDGVFWSGPLDPAFDFNQVRTIRPLELLDVQKKLNLTAYAMAGSYTPKGWSGSAGVDLNFDFSPRMTGNVTVYPEFDTIRTDQWLVNLTEFELRLDEIRDYFLKGFDDYLQPLEMFYTKRVGDLYGGAKFYGQAGPLEFTGSSLQTRKDDSQGLDTANFSTVRVKNNFGKFFELGVTAANRHIESIDLGSASTDALIKFGQHLKLYGLFSSSYGEYDKNNKAFLVKTSFDTTTFHTHFAYSQIEDRFWDNTHRIGYIQDDNRKEMDFALDKTFVFKLGEVEGLEYLSNYNLYRGMDDTLRGWQIDQELALLFGGGWRIGTHFQFDYKLNEYYPDFLPENNNIPISVWNVYRDKTIESMNRWDPSYIFDLVNPVIGSILAGDHLYLGSPEYNNQHVRIFSGFDSGDHNAFYLSYGFGRFYVRSMNTFNLYKEIPFSQDFYLQYEFSLIHYAGMIEPSYLDKSIHVLSANIQASPKVLLSTFFQTSSDRKITYLFLEGKYYLKAPLAYVQLVYEYGQLKFEGPKNNENALYLKLNYGF